MTFSSLGSAPLVPLRHASVGKLGERGRLPTGWRAENLASLEILEIEFIEGKPGVTIRLELAAAPSLWRGLSLGPHLAAAKHGVVALTGRVSLQRWTGIDGATLSLREWRAGGEMVRQADWGIQLAGEPQVGSVALEIGDNERVVQPMLLFRTRRHQTGEVTVGLAGLAFGLLQENPYWLWA